MFVLSAEDLFYLTISYTDHLLEFDDPHNLGARQEAESLWTELKLQLQNDKNPSETDANRAATLVTMVIQRCLSSYDLWRYCDLCSAISKGMDTNHVPEWDKLADMVDDIFLDPETLPYIHSWWEQQDDNPEWLSDQMEDLISEAEKEDFSMQDIPDKAAILQDLKPYFGENVVKAETFLLQIYGKSDVAVANAILSWRRKRNEINSKLNVKAFHKVLQDHHLYRATYDNLAKQIKI